MGIIHAHLQFYYKIKKSFIANLQPGSLCWLVQLNRCLIRVRQNQQIMKKQFFISGLLFAAIMLVGSTVWAQWNTTGNTTWTNNNVEIRGDRAFMQDGFQVARIHKGTHATAFTNTYAGVAAGSGTQQQTVFGYFSGLNNSGSRQSAFGWQAGRNNSGHDQSVLGFRAGEGNQGDWQVAFGYQAGFENTGEFQFAIGYQAGFQNTTDHQFAFGFRAGHSNTGHNQMAFGYEAGRRNEGDNLIAIGRFAGRDNTGNNCIFIGERAGEYNSEDNVLLIGHNPANSTPLIKGNLSTGELGINGLLIVDGKITSKEVEVKLDVWPDFVFHDDYELLSLNDVEYFIKQNGHLPNVPNEKEVTNNGINVGEISAILLQKIEELTLYMIALNKQNDELRMRISELEK